MPSPRYWIQRAPPPSPAALLHEILQWGPHASIPGERCAGLARRRSRRAHSLSPNLGRTASPIWPDLIYDRHNGGGGPHNGAGAARRRQPSLDPIEFGLTDLPGAKLSPESPAIDACPEA